MKYFLTIKIQEVMIKMLIIQIIGAVVAVVGAGYYGGFAIAEGKDDRGQVILGKSSQMVFPFFLFGVAFMLVFHQMGAACITNIESAISIWMTLICGISTVSLFMLKRKY